MKKRKKCMALFLVALQLFSVMPANQVSATETDEGTEPVVGYGTQQVATGSALEIATYDYSVIEGAGAIWTEGTLTFRVNADYSKLQGVSVDGAVLGAFDYVAYEGSTVVELSEGYLESLASGAHTLTVSFEDEDVDIPFTVQDNGQVSGCTCGSVNMQGYTVPLPCKEHYPNQFPVVVVYHNPDSTLNFSSGYFTHTVYWLDIVNPETLSLDLGSVYGGNIKWSGGFQMGRVDNPIVDNFTDLSLVYSFGHSYTLNTVPIQADCGCTDDYLDSIDFTFTCQSTGIIGDPIQIEIAVYPQSEMIEYYDMFDSDKDSAISRGMVETLRMDNETVECANYPNCSRALSGSIPAEETYDSYSRISALDETVTESVGQYKVYRNYRSFIDSIEVASYHLRFKAVSPSGEPVSGYCINGDYTGADGYTSQVFDFPLNATAITSYQDTYIASRVDLGGTSFNLNSYTDNWTYNGEHIGVAYSWVWEGLDDYAVGSNATVHGFQFDSSLTPMNQPVFTMELLDSMDTSVFYLEFDYVTSTYTLVEIVEDSTPAATDFDVSVNINNVYYDEFNMYHSASASFSETVTVAGDTTTVSFNTGTMIDDLEAELGVTITPKYITVELPNAYPVENNRVGVEGGSFTSSETGRVYNFSYDTTSGDAVFNLAYTNEPDLWWNATTENEAIARDLSVINIRIEWGFEEEQEPVGIKTTVKYVDFFTGAELAPSQVVELANVGDVTAVLDKNIDGYVAIAGEGATYVTLRNDEGSTMVYCDSTTYTTYYESSNFVLECVGLPSSGVYENTVLIKYYKLPEKHTVTVYKVVDNDYTNKVQYATVQREEEKTYVLSVEDIANLVSGATYKGYSTYEIADYQMASLDATADVSVTVYADTVIYLHYVTPITLTIVTEYYGYQGDLLNSDTTTVQTDWGALYTNSWTGNQDYKLYDAVKQGFGKISVSDYFFEDTTLVIRYIQTEKFVRVIDALHAEDGKQCGYDQRVVSLGNARTGTIRAKSIQGYAIATTYEGLYYDNGIEDNRYIYQYSETMGTGLGVDIYAESKEVDYHYEEITAELPDIDLSSFDFSMSGNNGGVSAIGNYVFVYKAVATQVTPTYTVIVKDRYVSIDGDIQKEDTRVTEELLEGSVYSYDALSPVPEGYVITSDTSYSGTVTDDIEIIFVYKEDAARFVTVKGYITYKDGTPIANKRIEIHSTPRYTTTDANGYYEVPNVEVGEHKFTIFASADVADTTPLVTCDLSVTKPDEDTVAVTFKAENCEVTTDTSTTNVLEIDAILPVYTITVIDEFYTDGSLDKREVRTEVTVKAGDSYSYDALSNTGYTVSGSETYSGVALSDLTLVFKYIKTTPVVNYYTLKVVDKYYNEDGELVRSNIRVEKVVEEGTPYSYNALTPAGYILTSAASYNGTVTADTTLVFTYVKEKPVYVPKDYTLKVIDKYYDELGSLERSVTRVNEVVVEGTSYSYDALNPKGYKVSGITHYEGTVTADTTLVFTYVKERVEPNRYTLKVIDKFFNENNKLESETVRLIETVVEGTGYYYEALIVDGYVVSGAKVYSGIVSGDVTLAFTYVKSKPVIVIPEYVTITVIDNFYDSTSVLEQSVVRETVIVEKGTTYKYNALNIQGYVLSGASEYEGVATEDVTLVFSYIKEVEEPEEYTITVIDEFYDEDGYFESCNVRLTEVVEVGTSYFYEALAFEDYVVSGSSSYTGVITEDTTLVFTYTKEKVEIVNEYTVTVIEKYIVEAVAPAIDASFGGFITEDLNVSISQVKGKTIYTVARTVRCVDTYAEGATYEYFANCPVLMKVVGAESFSGVVTDDITLEFVYYRGASDISDIPEEVLDEEPEPVIPWAEEPKTGDGQLPVNTAKPFLPYVVIALPVAVAIFFKKRKKHQ